MHNKELKYAWMVRDTLYEISMHTCSDKIKGRGVRKNDVNYWRGGQFHVNISRPTKLGNR